MITALIIAYVVIAGGMFLLAWTLPDYTTLNDSQNIAASLIIAIIWPLIVVGFIFTRIFKHG